MNYPTQETSVTEQSIKNLESFTRVHQYNKLSEYTQQRSTIQPKPKLKDEEQVTYAQYRDQSCTKQWRQSIYSEQIVRS
jgi:hypothetical protein